MNARAAEALYAAERKGVKQLKGMLSDGRGGHCAMGVIQALDSRLCDQIYATPRETDECPACGEKGWWGTEGMLVAHFNNDHRMTFSEIARKLGPDSL